MTDIDPNLSFEGLVHDLRNIFETILDTAETIGRDAKHLRAANRIQRCVQQGERMLSSLVEQKQASLDLDVILDDALEFARTFLQIRSGAKIEFVRSVEQGLRLRGNPAAWERVFMNLFLNAAQAMPEEGGTVEIKASRTDTAIEIDVSDNGPGISPKILPRIFEAHFSTRAKRSGLGLHIVKSIVESYGGQVAAANRPEGTGAFFHITLPYLV
jgi:signal transduction histidine kinase